MISANELRIGNWVNNALSQPIQVEVENIKWAQDIYPIPLSPEIMFKAGFTYSDPFWQLKHHNAAGLIEIYDSEEDGQPYIYNWQASIRYVHQLQNLVHALSNAELEVNL